MCETHVRASHQSREGKPTRTVFDKKFARSRDTYLRQQREASIGFHGQRVRMREEQATKRRRVTSEDSSSSSSNSSNSSDSETSSESSDDGRSERAAPLDFAKAKNNSAKSSYLAKVLGPVAEYGANYELFQFVYDLWLWSSLGGKKNKGMNCPLHLTMKQYSFSPEYWQTKHASLIDLVRQLGLPSLFITLAPYEWSFPLHQWVEDEMKKQMRSKLHLPVAETLHIAHVLAQSVIGLLTGANRTKDEGKKKAWSSHVFGPKDGSKRKTVVNHFARLEFQDGKRKRYINWQELAQLFYHGRGTVHVHLLIWLENIEAIKLPDIISATSPLENAPLQAIVEGSQRSYTGSGWQKQDQASYFDGKAKQLKLYHSDSDHCTYVQRDGGLEAQGLRAYIIDLIASLACHMDVLSTDGRGMLLRYVSSYVPKFSDSFTSEWLNEACSGYEVSRRVLTDYHPLEPEMVLQLAMQWFPQVFAGGSHVRFVVPVPWKAEISMRVQQYMNCEWRPEVMTLIQFLRITNKHGCIHEKIQKRYKAAVKEAATTDAMEVWACAQPSRGETMIAAMYLSRYNDEYYGNVFL